MSREDLAGLGAEIGKLDRAPGIGNISRCNALFSHFAVNNVKGGYRILERHSYLMIIHLRC